MSKRHGDSMSAILYPRRRWTFTVLLASFTTDRGSSLLLHARRQKREWSNSAPSATPLSRPYSLTTPSSPQLQESTLNDSDTKYPRLERLTPKYPEEVAKWFVSENFATDARELNRYVQYVTMIRVATPATLAAAFTYLVYPSVSLTIAAIINDPSVFDVVSTDASQYIQNILTTCGLVFVLLTGNTYYFLYQQQEAIFLALFEEVTVAKSLLEQVALVCQGRRTMYRTLMDCIKQYVRDDLRQFNVEPSVLLSARPIDDPLENIMYMTSVGEPSIVYQTVRTLRQARAHRLGALQRKLPQIHMVLLWTLAGVVLCTFPLLGAGSQVIGGYGILQVQACYLSFIVFGIATVLGVINELRDPGGKGAYNVVSVLVTMVQGLEDELEGRLEDKYLSRVLSPTIDVAIPEDGNEYNQDMEAVLLESHEDKLPFNESGGKQHSSPGLLKRIANRIRRQRKES